MPRYGFDRLAPCFVIGTVLVALGSVMLNQGLAAEPAIRLVEEPGKQITAFEAVGLSEKLLSNLRKLSVDDERFASFLSIRVIDKAVTEEQPAMAGDYVVGTTALRFTPRYALRPGLRYRVTLRLMASDSSPTTEPGAKVAGVISREVLIPEKGSKIRAEVDRIFPSVAILPENQLRFYIHFTEPMSRGEAYEHLRLLDQAGTPVDHPFLELGEELWDPSGRRLTLLIDPGRIKQGLKPRLDAGPVLEAGQEYSLVVDARWPDATGRLLSREFRKRFKVAGPQSSAINTADWKFDLPQAGSTAPLTIRFPQPLDRALLERTLRIASEPGGGRPLSGRVAVADDERRWEFHPEEPWKTGTIDLVVDTVLEDLAGNRIGRPFEVDENTSPGNRAVPETVRIPLTIKSAPSAQAGK